MRLLPRFAPAIALSLGFAATSFVNGAEQTLASPDGHVVVTVSDTEGLHYRVALDGQPTLVDSRLGLDLAGGTSLGRAAHILASSRDEHDGTWENPFGRSRVVPDRYHELKVELAEEADAPKRLNLIVRAYDNGVALRYEIPNQPGLETYAVTNELTEFIFPSDLKCWVGNPSGCAECQYPEKRLTQLSTNIAWSHVPPLLVQLPNGYAAITESDLIDWAGMFLAQPVLAPTVRCDPARKSRSPRAVTVTGP
jgi:alpha-glucosidase